MNVLEDWLSHALARAGVYDTDRDAQAPVAVTRRRVLCDHLNFKNIDGQLGQHSTECIPSPPAWIFLPGEIFLFLGLHTKFLCYLNGVQAEW